MIIRSFESAANGMLALIRSVPGKGFYVCEYNPDYLKEKRYMDLEKRLEEIVEDCKKAGMKKDDIIDIIDTLMD